MPVVWRLASIDKFTFHQELRKLSLKFWTLRQSQTLHVMKGFELCWYIYPQCDSVYQDTE